DPQLVLAEYNGGPLNPGYFRGGGRQLASGTRKYGPQGVELYGRLKEEFAKGAEAAGPGRRQPFVGGRPAGGRARAAGAAAAAGGGGGGGGRAGGGAGGQRRLHPGAPPPAPLGAALPVSFPSGKDPPFFGPLPEAAAAAPRTIPLEPRLALSRGRGGTER